MRLKFLFSLEGKPGSEGDDKTYTGEGPLGPLGQYVIRTRSRFSSNAFVPPYLRITVQANEP